MYCVFGLSFQAQRSLIEWRFLRRLFKYQNYRSLRNCVSKSSKYHRILFIIEDNVKTFFTFCFLGASHLDFQ